MKICHLRIWLIRAAAPIAVAAAGGFAHKLAAPEQKGHPTVAVHKLDLYFPFGFSKKIDPRFVHTVGDQVLCEHLFAFHGNRSFRKGYVDTISRVEFRADISQIEFHRKEDLHYSDGRVFSQEKICESVLSSLQGTQHSSLKTLISSHSCSDSIARVRFKHLPANLRDLLRLPDFAIFDPETLPLTAEKVNQATTGPYFLKSLEPRKAVLGRNPFYPRSLVANTVKEVNINGYTESEIESLIRIAEPATHPLIYMTGYSIDKTDLVTLRSKGYRVEQYPSEWLLHFGFQPSASLESRRFLGKLVDQWRPNLPQVNTLGQPAYSGPPTDRPFGLRIEEYLEATTTESKLSKTGLNRPLKIATMEYWSKLPIVQSLLKHLENKLGSQAEIHILAKNRYDELYTDAFDVYLGTQGVSKSDPLHHLAFFMNSDKVFAEVISETLLARLSALNDATEFIHQVRDIEKNIAKKRVLIPVAHFPGVVAESPTFERDDELAGSWGIRAWTYKTH